MKRAVSLLLIVLLFMPLGAATAQTSTSTAFTYQGQLRQGGVLYTGTCDFELTLWDALTSGAQIGSTQTITGAAVDEGLFTVQVDFGGSAFGGQARWLETAVQCAGDPGYTTLAPRQELTATPYSIYALGAPWSGLTGVPAGFADGVDDGDIYTSGYGLALNGTEFSVVTGTIQTRVTTTCIGFSAITGIEDTGSATCTQLVGSGWESISPGRIMQWSSAVDNLAEESNLYILAASPVTLTVPASGEIQYRVSGVCADDGDDATVMKEINSDGTTVCEQLRLNEIANPAGDTTIDIGSETVTWNFNNSAGGMVFDYNQDSSGHLMEITQAGTDAEPGTHLLHIESDDPDAVGLHVLNNAGTTALVVQGNITATGAVTLTGNISMTGSITASTAIGARVYNSIPFTHTSTGNWVAITFNSERFDTDEIHSTASNTSRLTCQRPGVVSLSGSIVWTASATGWRGLRIYANGTTPVATVLQPASSATFSIAQTVSTIYQCSADTYFELQAFQDTAGNLSIAAQGNTSPEFGMVRVP